MPQQTNVMVLVRLMKLLSRDAGASDLCETTSGAASLAQQPPCGGQRTGTWTASRLPEPSARRRLGLSCRRTLVVASRHCSVGARCESATGKTKNFKKKSVARLSPVTVTAAGARVRDSARYCAIVRDIARYCAILGDIRRY